MKKLIPWLFIPCASIVLIGCSDLLDAGSLDRSDTDDPAVEQPDLPPEGLVAKSLFDNNVLPLLATCGGDLCHSASSEATLQDPPKKFLRTGIEGEFYALITRDPELHGGFQAEASDLITHIHTGPGIDYNVDQLALITEWLTEEFTWRQVQDPDSVVNPIEELAKFSGCMDVAIWNATGAFNIAQMPSASGSCMSCHNSGAGGLYMYIGDPPQQQLINEMFEMNRYQLTLQKLVKFTGKVGAISQFAVNYDILDSRRLGNGTHPTYNINLNPSLGYLLQLEDFVLQTQDRVNGNAENCTAVGFPQLPPGQQI